MDSSVATQHPSNNAISSNCFSLQTSRYCGGTFANYYMSSHAKVNGQYVLDAHAFDSVLDGYFNSSSEFTYINSFFNCEAWSGYPTPRYRIAYTCRSLLESAEAKLCNKLRQPPPLCKTSCSVYVSQWAEMTNNTKLCRNTALAESSRLSLAESCDSAPYNGSLGCIPGIESGAEICGFTVLAHPTKNQRSAVCDFCKHSGDSCCTSREALRLCGVVTSHTFYIAIITSMSLLLLLIGVTILRFFHKRAHRKRMPSSPVSQASTELPGPSVINYWPKKRKLQPAGTSNEWCDTDSVFVSAPSTPTQGRVQGPRPNPDALSRPQLNTTKNGRRTVAQQLVAFLGTTANSQLHTFAAKVQKTASRMMPNIERKRKLAQKLSASDQSEPLSPRLGNAEVSSLPPQLAPHLPLLHTPVLPADLNRLMAFTEPNESVPGDTSPPKVLRCPPPDITISKRNQSLRGRPSIDQAFYIDIHRKEKQQEPAEGLAKDGQAVEPDLFTVLYPYMPVENDELSIRPGEMVRVLRLFLDGWTFVQRMDDGAIGAVPAVCLDTDLADIEFATLHKMLPQ
ncbi:hypothetical protein FBU59_001965 [Linderina macrospora]|uniref:Uncharacterized protein n=1 Tax=Linderina macrospora TaxID=4868 RepID=A0ACC1JCT3_9FUNG|nr:hypothetical protein FBU59_001965 [Linderina macrospora]